MGEPKDKVMDTIKEAVEKAKDKVGWLLFFLVPMKGLSYQPLVLSLSFTYCFEWVFTEGDTFESYYYFVDVLHS